ncbi:ran-binding protein 1 homolog a-like [Phragmites australis]|uniref:ran-binding protein 1 homolog a-like n=1 Tax=Phragmites australis TaxID=29695 RepID=UPI002D784D45|nr:ran-binding protein 1 homolog a-like [Phragmites australis]
MADKEPVVERPEAAAEEDASAAAGEEEDTGAPVAPIVRLEEVAVTTGEEDEDVLLDMKAKLYRFDKDGNQWKERGTGTVKLLKHKESGKVRLVMRQAKTLKICANHIVISTTKMQEHAGSDKSCVWHAADFADGELKEEMFAIRFGSVENCKKFKDFVEEIAESLAKNKDEESEEGSSTAGLMEKLTVSESKSEESAKAESTESVKEAETKAEATPSE